MSQQDKITTVILALEAMVCQLCGNRIGWEGELMGAQKFLGRRNWQDCERCRSARAALKEYKGALNSNQLQPQVNAEHIKIFRGNEDTELMDWLSNHLCYAMIHHNGLMVDLPNNGNGWKGNELRNAIRKYLAKETA